MHFDSFAHLHVHSDYSLLSGAIPVKKMLDRAVEMHQPAIALTDHGNLFGAVEFYTEALRRGVKPILGCEVCLCNDHTGRKTEGSRPRYPQLLLLARNNHGWKNLMRLISIAWLDGFYYKPRVDKALLREYGDGLIALSSGWHGEIEKHLQNEQIEAAEAVAREYASIFPHHSFFIEIQRHVATGQEELNRQLIELAHRTEIPLVATNNAHFISRDDFHAFEAMLALQQNKTLNDDVSGHYTPECYLKTYKEMSELFADIPEAIENSLHIAQRCNVDMQFGHYQLPDFCTPNGEALEDFIRQQAQQGLDARWPLIVQGVADAQREDYDKRLSYELDIIERMGFPGYFLIVADFIAWAKEQDIPVGPGRGSGAGSLVAYALGITGLDPIRYGLLFERFLNPERISMPDFDIDFCMDRRPEVIRYVTEKYGADHVAQIITFGSMKAKAVVRDVGRVLDMPYGKVDELAKLIPNDLNMTLDKALTNEPRLSKRVGEDADTGHLFEIASRLEGMHRHAGKHAAGVVIARTPLVETAPLAKDLKENTAMVQWDMKCAERVGLVKFDFLGLKTLTVLHIACTLVRQYGQSDAARSFDLETIPLADPSTFKLLSDGQTGAVFQLESSGMRDLLTRIRPDSFEDIIALVALYRPGPLESGMVDDFIACKRGDKTAQYALPQLQPILQETNGVILYQEQVMKIAQVLAGYSLGQADMLRRAMGKKKPEEMAKQRQIFMDGAIKNKIAEDKAEHIFDLMEKFAGYGFNKSHSAAYALIAWQTAYLKAHYPKEFMAATLSCDMGNSDKIHALISDCHQMNIEVLPPDINTSDWVFTPEKDAIRFGLGAIKGVGEAAIRQVVEVRTKDGKFTSFDDLCVRLPSKVLNKRMLEAMIKAGAMHELIPHQAAALAGLADAVKTAARKRHDLNTKQSALFEVAEPRNDDIFPDVSAWRMGECLQAEREVLGFYLTGHPLEEYLGRVQGLSKVTLADVGDLPNDSHLVLPVGISSVRTHRGARGTMAFVQVEDLQSGGEIVFFASEYEKAAPYMDDGRALLIAVRVDRSRGELSLIAEDIAPLDELLPSLVAEVCIHAHALRWDAQTIKQCKQLLEQHKGSAKLCFQVQLADGSIAKLVSSHGIMWNTAVQQQLESCFDREALQLRCHPWQPEQSTGNKSHKYRERVKHAA